MGIKKVTLLSLDNADESRLDNLYSLGSEVINGRKKSVKVAMSLLRGNTAFREWQERNLGKTYADWIALLQAPAQEAADGIDELKDDLTKFGEAAIASEKARVEAEKQRVEIEKLRVEAEKARASAESLREDNEIERVDKESARIVEEELRKQDEQKRKENELARQGQEEQREQGTVEAILNAEKATDRLNELSDHRDEIRDGYWWRWDETKKNWYNTGENAKGNLMYATFDLDPSTGQLTMFTEEEYTGANFEITEKGELQVII